MKLPTKEILLLGLPFILWIICFWDFFSGRLPLFADAISYADHIKFYADNLSHGIYPLWDPTWFNGVPNDFFLRRLGDVNPLLWLIVLLKWVGVPLSTAYLIFNALYYFLAGWAFYLIARLLFKERFFAFIAYVIFFFSSWGSEIFYNYIIIIFVPIIWFFYFLLSFSRQAQKSSFLGMCFCIGIILTTYIPFFFLTILALFVFFYVLFYAKEALGFIKRLAQFLFQNKTFTFLCIFLLVVSCLPGLFFYKESKGGEFVLPGRHSGADVSSAVAVGMENAASGDIISHGYFDRIFNHQSHIDMGDIYFPYIFFLFLICTLAARVNKMIFFLLFNILALCLITITSAAKVHQFLYEHLLIFKFIRQLYYFFWLAMLPMAVLLAVAAFKSLLAAIDESTKKKTWFVYIVACHLIFIAFLTQCQGVLTGAWVAVAISLVYFLIYFWFDRKISCALGFFLLFLSVFIQSAQVYAVLDKNLFEYLKNAKIEQARIKPVEKKLDLYYTTNWFNLLDDYLNPTIFLNYRTHLFILYDNVFPYVDSPEFLKSFEGSIASHRDLAYIPKFESTPDDWSTTFDNRDQPDLDPVSSKELTVLYSDANTFKLKTHLAHERFLVINDNYHPQWHASINGRPARLFRANVSFKGLWVPAGDSVVEFTFSSVRWYLFHYCLIVLYLFIFVYLLILLGNRKRYG